MFLRAHAPLRPVSALIALACGLAVALAQANTTAAETGVSPGVPLAAASATAADDGGSHPSTAATAAPQKRKKRHHARKAKSSAVRDDGPDSFVYGHRDDVTAFATQVAADRGLDRDWVVAQLAQARYEPSVARLIMPARVGTAKNYAAYRARFVEPRRIEDGVQWWHDHARELDAAQRQWGVPPEIVTAIVGVETFYGRLVGRYRVLDALATLSFDFPRGRTDRSGFYRDELRDFLVWCALENREPDSVRGSFAGAIGWPQFMPSALLRNAVDFDHDGHVDLSSGGADVVGSVASYLADYGWQRGVPTTFPVQPPADPAARAQLLAPDIVPHFTAPQMIALGARLPEAARDYAGALALVELQNGNAPPSDVAGTANFYVITRYNWSSYYAMTVIDLAAALKRERESGPTASLQ